MEDGRGVVRREYGGRADDCRLRDCIVGNLEVARRCHDIYHSYNGYLDNNSHAIVTISITHNGYLDNDSHASRRTVRRTHWNSPGGAGPCVSPDSASGTVAAAASVPLGFSCLPLFASIAPVTAAWMARPCPRRFARSYTRRAADASKGCDGAVEAWEYCEPGGGTKACPSVAGGDAGCAG